MGGCHAGDPRDNPRFPGSNRRRLGAGPGAVPDVVILSSGGGESWPLLCCHGFMPPAGYIGDGDAVGDDRRGVVAVDAPVVAFAGLLRQLRVSAGLSQEELAEAAGVGVRTVSDLERGVALTARKDTTRLLADALNLSGTDRASFEAVARGRAAAGVFPAPGDGVGAPGGVAAATRALPRDIGSFTGRQLELRQLVGVSAGSSPPGVVSIHAIGGMAGIGKTALAVHAAHQLAPRFPDGQIFLPLHGHTPGQRPVDPADALASLLLSTGVSAARIPPGLEARTVLWRDRLAGKQLLLLLDDAADSEQVRPLLPGSAGSLVLVTSRRHLTALEDAQAVSLDILPAGHAAELLVLLAGRPGLDPGDPEVAEITRLCGYLPLAVGMLARQLHHHPAWTAADLAADLAAARDRLQLLHAENLSVAAAFDLSYQDLTPGQQRLFRRLGLHPGADTDAYAAAALDGTELGTARRHLEALYDQYLIAEPARGRYRLHDLIREHARTLAALDPPAERDAATSRLMDYYTHTAAVTERRLARQPKAGPDLAVVVPPGAVPDLPDHAHALAWARAERANLLACLAHAGRGGQHARVVTLTTAMAALLWQDGPWTDALARHLAAIDAARQAGDQPGEARAHNDLGDVRLVTADYPAAAEAYQAALSISRDLGDRLGEANATANVGLIRFVTGDYPGATQATEQALRIYQDLGNRHGEANALYEIGYERRVTGDYPGATRAAEQALRIFQDLGDRLGEAWALMDDLGETRQKAGDYPGATRAVEEALRICQDLGDSRGQANALIFLGFLRFMTGDLPGAAQVAEQALRLCRDLGDRIGEACALAGLGQVRCRTGDYPGATQATEQALSIYQDIGARGYEANVLLELGIVRRLTGRYSSAAQATEQALRIYQDLGDPAGEAEALNEAGMLYRVRGRTDQAGACHRQALAIARKLAAPWHEAHALAGLGRCARADGRRADAQASLGQALEIFRRIGTAEATDVAADIAALARPQPGQKQ
jgi:tetratricopeptide (TPR) repeat protein/transcriptional regulator with XRE-family HTH domain